MQIKSQQPRCSVNPVWGWFDGVTKPPPFSGCFDPRSSIFSTEGVFAEMSSDAAAERVSKFTVGGGRERFPLNTLRRKGEKDLYLIKRRFVWMFGYFITICCCTLL